MSKKPDMSDTDKETSQQGGKEENPNYKPDGSPKLRTYVSVFGWVFAVSAALAAPFTIPPILEKIKKSRGK